MVGLRARAVVVIMAGALLVALSVIASSTEAGAMNPRMNTTVGTAGCTGPGECIANVGFGNVPVGTHIDPDNFWLNNDYPATATVDFATGLYFSGPGNATDYSVVPSAGCPGASTGTITMTSGYSCLISVYFSPSALGDRSTQLIITPSVGAPGTVNLSGTGTPNILNFGDTTLGTYAGPDTFSLQNYGSSTDTFDLYSGDLSISGPGANDYVVTPSSDCPGDGVTTVVLAAGAACTMNVYFYPGALGDRSATMTIRGAAGTAWSGSLSGNGTIGYYQVDAQGNVTSTDDAGYYGDTGSLKLNHPIVGMAATGDDGGYWLVASDGGIFSFGDAAFYGSTGAIHLNKPIVGMAPTSDAGGYWLVASDGGIFSFGDAAFYGSTGAIHLNKPIVGMAPTSDAGGYWLVASDGGIFSFGDAAFYGSTGAIHLNKPIVGMAPTSDAGGYWLVASDGGIFSFGDAAFYGSTGAIHLNKPIVGMAPMPTGNGYWFTAADGGLFNFGDAPFYGSGVGTGLGQVVDMASDGGPTVQAQADIPAIRQAHVSGPGSAARHVPHFAGP